jgi:hypothetical protein
MINRFLDIGFKFIKTEYTGSGYTRIYKYYSKYLSDAHYILYTYTNCKENEDCINPLTDYRLYVRNNDPKHSDYFTSIFQVIPHYDLNGEILNEYFNKEFGKELRSRKIEDIFKDDDY